MEIRIAPLEVSGRTVGLGSSASLFSKALEAVRRSGGGVVRVLAGDHLLGPLDLPSGLTLVVEKGAVLRFTDDFEAYHPVLTRWEGAMCHAMHPLVFARGVRNLRIEGEGTLDGQGRAWWEALKEKRRGGQNGPVLSVERALAALDKGDPKPSGGGGRETFFLRPPLIQLFECEDVSISGIRLKDSPFWTLHPIYSRRIDISGIRIENPSDAPNTDGIDIDSCEDVRIEDCLVDVGDDCLALKAGSGALGVEEGRPTRRVSVSGCTFRSGHGGVVVGSETAGGVEDVEVSDCRFLGTDRGIRIKSRRGRGGLVRNLGFSDLRMEGVLAPVTINLYYNCGADPKDAPRLFSLDPIPPSALTPMVRDIRIARLEALGCRASAGFVAGLPESRIENLSLEDCRITLAREGLVPVENSEMYQGLPATESRGLRLRHVDCEARGLSVEGGSVDLEEGARLENR